MRENEPQNTAEAIKKPRETDHPWVDLPVEDDSLGEQQIAQVFQKGYTCKGKVIRHTVVKVAN